MRDCNTGFSQDDVRRFLAERSARIQARRAQAGLGDAASDLKQLPLPGPLERYLATGAPMGTFRRDLGAATAQIPRLVYGLGAVLAVLFGAKAYKRWRDEPRRASEAR